MNSPIDLSSLFGESSTFEHFFEPLQRHFHINAYQVSQGRFATVFQDITDRKQAEAPERLVKQKEKAESGPREETP